MNTAKKFNLWMGIALLILCFFIIFVVYPLILILYKSVIDPESSKLTLDYFTKFFARKYYWSTLLLLLSAYRWLMCCAASKSPAVNTLIY